MVSASFARGWFKIDDPIEPRAKQIVLAAVTPFCRAHGSGSVPVGQSESYPLVSDQFARNYAERRLFWQIRLLGTGANPLCAVGSG